MFVIKTQKGFVSTFSNTERGIVQFTQVDAMGAKFHDQGLAQGFVFRCWEHLRGTGAKVVRYVPPSKGGAASKAFHNADSPNIRKGK